MSRAFAVAPIGFAAFAVALALTAFAVQRGLVGEDAVTLWAGAIGAGGGGVVALAREGGLPVPENLAKLGEDGCKPPALAPQTTWPVTRHFTTALFRFAFGIDRRPVGLNTRAAQAFGPAVTATYTQTLR